MHRGRLMLHFKNYFGCAWMQMFWLGNKCTKPLTYMPGRRGMEAARCYSPVGTQQVPFLSDSHRFQFPPNGSFLLIEKFLSMYTMLFSTQIPRKEWGWLNPLRFSYYTQMPLKIPVLFNSIVSFLIFSVYPDSHISTHESPAERGGCPFI